MKTMNKLLFATVILILTMDCTTSQNNISNVKITREKIGNTTILHFIDRNTNKQLYTKNITSTTLPSHNPIHTSVITPNKELIKQQTLARQKPTSTNELTLNTPKLNQPYFKYAIAIIVILIVLAIIVWQLGKDNTEGEKK